MNNRKIIWDKQAINYFRDALRFIRKDSPQNADKVKADIFKAISKIPNRPEAHPPDKYKLNNTGNYRAFELHHFRIGYLIKENEIIISRLRSAKQEPRDY